jgi:integrase
VPTFKKVAKDWLEYKKPNVRASTYRMYRGHVDNHFSLVNDLKINRIMVATVEKFTSDRRENNVSLPLIRKTLMTFGQIMNYAVRHLNIDHNPVSEAERPRSTGNEEKVVIRILKPSEITRFLDNVPDLMYHTLFMIAVMSGLRQGEIIGLKWTDILWDKRQIHVQRTFNNGRWYKPKSNHSIRKVDVGDMVLRQLKQWRLAWPSNKMNLIFASHTGKPLDRSYVSINYFSPSLKAAGLPKIRFHDLRHTYARLLIDQGENIKYVQKQLGHSKPSVTLDIYSHLLSENNPEAVNRLDEKVSGSKMVASG